MFIYNEYLLYSRDDLSCPLFHGVKVAACILEIHNATEFPRSIRKVLLEYSTIWCSRSCDNGIIGHRVNFSKTERRDWRA